MIIKTLFKYFVIYIFFIISNFAEILHSILVEFFAFSFWFWWFWLSFFCSRFSVSFQNHWGLVIYKADSIVSSNKRFTNISQVFSVFFVFFVFQIYFQFLFLRYLFNPSCLCGCFPIDISPFLTLSRRATESFNSLKLNSRPLLLTISFTISHYNH